MNVNDRRGREGFEVWFGKLKAMAAKGTIPQVLFTVLFSEIIIFDFYECNIFRTNLKAMAAKGTRPQDGMSSLMMKFAWKGN